VDVLRGRAGTRIRSEALHRMLFIGRPAADRAGARPYQLTFTLDSNELLGQRKTRMAVGENSAPSRSWRSVACNAFGRQAEALMQEAKAGAFADSCERQRLEPSLTYNCERQRLEPSLTQLQEAKAGAFAYLQLREAKAGAFADSCERQRLEPSLTTAEAKAGAFAYTTARGKGWSLRLQLQEAKAGAFAYLQLREAKAGAFAYTTAGGKGWSLRLQ
jgi:hypothetical protein